MGIPRIPCRLTVVAALLVACSAEAPPESSAVALFDGDTLRGWTGNTGHWTVEGGCLVGRTTEDAPLDRSVYLFHELQAADFVLEFDYLLRGGNSGMQYRSRRLPGGEVAGYQADLEAGPDYTGILYESEGRGILATRGQRLRVGADGTRELEAAAFGTAEALQAHVRAEDWNHYRVEARGPLLIHEVNGHRTIEVHDVESGRARSDGLFALQLHQGPPMEVRFRDIRFTRLPEQRTRRAEWIWGPAAADGEQRWFLHRFELEAPVVLQPGVITCDNSFQAWLDGDALAEGDDWSAPARVDGGLQLDAGSHWLVVLATNEGGPAGLVVELPWENARGQRGVLRTSDAWLTLSSEPSGWPQPPELPQDARPATSWGPVDAHRGPWGNLLAPARATAEDAIHVPAGYRVRRVHSARSGEGSWSSFTFADDGTAYACGERGGLIRFRFPDGHDGPPTVELLDTPVVAAQGLEWADDALYANVAGPADGIGGLHRLRDRDGDGEFEEHDHLQSYGPATEHGAHGIRLGPDGMLYTVHGNYTSLPPGLDLANSPHVGWAEDELVTRIWDPRGHAHGILAPGAVVLRTDLDGKRWELVAGGMRNPYDLDFAPDGELFTYDADMEWDVGAPWYRAPRVVHVVPGGESGWRSGSAKWPSRYPDSEPPVLETGPASPVGICFGTDAAFPAPMQRALFLGDWAYGRILAAELRPDGAGFTGNSEVFVRGAPLPVTDLEIGPDGALWFTTGGRGAQSGLYRVDYVGDDSTAPAETAAPTDDARLRIAIARGEVTEATLRNALGHPDRAIRAAARRLVERDPERRAALLFGADPGTLAGLELLLARTRSEADSGAGELAAALAATDFDALAVDGRWLVARAAMILHMRAPAQPRSWRGALDTAARGWLQHAVADAQPSLQRELAALLVAIDGPDLPPLLMDRFRAAEFPAARIHYGLLLRLCTQGWLEGDREELLVWLRRWRTQPAGLSLAGFLQTIETEILANLPEVESAAILAHLPEPTPPEIGAAGARPFARDWTVDTAEQELRAFAAAGSTASAGTGARLFRELACIQCHRHSGEGGSLAPDLSSVGARFGQRELLEAILTPAAVQSDQYPWTVMPEGLADSLDPAELAALLEFLQTG